MRQIEDFFSPPENKTLYHYTSISALVGIVETGKIWASHAYYLQDSKEILHACSVMKRVLSESIQSYEGQEKEFVLEFDQWLESFRDIPYQIFIFSFSEERSLLSQWRSYTPHGKGVSIGFSTAKLNQIAKGMQFRIAQCIYAWDAQRELMCGLLDKMLVTFRQRLPFLDTSTRPPSQKYHEFLEEFRGDILQVLAIIKDSAFAEEQEWRLVSPYFPSYAVPDIKFREGASMLLPYIEIDLPRGNDRNLLFETVILGPSQHANLSIAALGSYLVNKRACSTTECQHIPYREW
jgi:hypothetical protein